MLGLSREALEFTVIGLSSARIAYSLWSAAGLGANSATLSTAPRVPPVPLSNHQPPRAGWELIGLVCTTVAAVGQEVLSTQHHSGVKGRLSLCIICQPAVNNLLSACSVWL